MIDAVVIGLSATGLAVVRALGRRGLRVAGVDPRRWEIGHASRYARTSTGLGVEALRELAGESRPAIHVAGDPELAWAIDHASELAEGLAVPASWRDGSAAAALDKRLHYARCEALGVPLPRTWYPARDADLAAIAAEARFPVLVKPARGAASPPVGPGKLLVCRDAHALAAVREREIVIQEWIPGEERDLWVCGTTRRADGSFGPVLTARKQRQWPPDVGSGARVEVAWDDEVCDRSLALVEALGLTGPVGVEWKRSAGRLVLVEVNPRPVLWFGLAEAVIADAQAELTGRPPPDAPIIEARWQYLVRDVAAAGRHALPTAEVLALEAADDPLPGLLGAPYTALLWTLRHLRRR